MPDAVARAARRVKVGATLDPDLVAAVDRYVAGHPGIDRSGVLDEALRLWYERQQEEAMVRQFTAPRSAVELKEARAWQEIRRASWTKRFGGRRK